MKIRRLWHMLVGHSERGAVTLKEDRIAHVQNDRDFVAANLTLICKCGVEFTCQRMVFRDGVDGFLARSSARVAERKLAQQSEKGKS